MRGKSGVRSPRSEVRCPKSGMKNEGEVRGPKSEVGKNGERKWSMGEEVFMPLSSFALSSAERHE